jgi:FtsH-binding integral membrane protein
MPDGYALVMAILKLLKWIEEKLPDKPRLGLILLVIGAVIVGLTLMLFSQEYLGANAADLESVWFFLGGTCAVLGSYILFRRAVWIWQDKRAPRITTFRLR